METIRDAPRRPGPNVVAVAAATGLLLAGVLVLGANQRRSPDQDGPAINPAYAPHTNIMTTIFWVGEPGSEENRNIHNLSSTWTENWVGAYGGIDEPEPRCDLLPCDFTPKENAFYFALPYNDLDESCQAKASQRNIPWYATQPPPGESIVKNRWIKIIFEGLTAYAQWEDAGPYGEDDADYVFGSSQPNSEAGLDVSPAVAGYLGLGGQDLTTWQFIDERDVPEGPWRQTVTRSPPDCADQV
jgi:hypothetical protein